MTTEAVRWANAARTRIYIETDELTPGEVIPLEVSAKYDTRAGRDLFARASSGEFGVVSAYVPPSSQIVPQIVTRAQFKLALLDLDLLDDVESLVAASNDRALQINWAERLEFERNHPLVIATAAALGKNAAEIDALFVLAASK